MTDEIMIDKVDVSGCELYRDDNGIIAPDGTAERTELCSLTNDYCAKNPNCHFKQLQREKQNSQEARDTSIKEFNRAERYKQALNEIRAISCQINLTIAGGIESPADEWRPLYNSTMDEIFRVINEALKEEK